MIDLLVIGAGLSGLQAALTAKQAGLSVLILEARDRVGGKVHSVPVPSSQGVADLGAAWVNDTLQPIVWGYIQRFGLKTSKQPIDGTAVMQVDKGNRLEFPFGIGPPDEKENLIRIRDHIEHEATKEALRPEDDKVTLDEYVRALGANEKTAKMVNIWTRAMHGVESTEESAAYFIDYCCSNHGLMAVRADDSTGGNYLRLQGGTHEIASNMAALISEHIQLSTPVKSITNSASSVTVHTTTGLRSHARKCILSIPSTMYRELTITPPLPPRLSKIADNTRLGHYNKAIIIYTRPWWRQDHGLNGFFFSYMGPVSIARDSSIPEKGLYAIICFVNGRAGHEWNKLRPEGRKHAILSQLSQVYNLSQGSDVWRPLDFFDQIWQHEEYSRGALAPIPALGHFVEFRDVYGRPVQNLHFVGTEYSGHWRGYMEGALDSGVRGAKEVIDSLKDAEEKARL